MRQGSMPRSIRRWTGWTSVRRGAFGARRSRDSWQHGASSDAMSLPPSQPPFADWPVQVTTRAGYIWYTEPGVLVTQSHIERSTLDDVRAMTDRIDAVLRLKKAELKKTRGLLIVHDWRSLKTWENGARELMVE